MSDYLEITADPLKKTMIIYEEPVVSAFIADYDDENWRDMVG